MAKSYGEWVIERDLSEGGQAFIYIVRHTNGKLGILKRLKNIKRIERFKQEIVALQNTNHDYIPKILDYDLGNEKPYYVMEYYDKGCLTEDIIKSWTLEERSELYLKILDAVEAAHKQSIIHRDIKPENILIDYENNPKVSDFGLCYEENGERKTLIEEAVGSFKYMAPEMEDGKSENVGTQTDVYSLGKLAYWLLSGGKIYNRETHRDQKHFTSLKPAPHWVYFLFEFLDKATSASVDNRIKDISQLRAHFLKVKDAIVEDFRYLDLAIPQNCIFCKKGNYKIEIDSRKYNLRELEKLHQFGFNRENSPRWLILICDVCGNVQMFRDDRIKNSKWKSTIS